MTSKIFGWLAAKGAEVGQAKLGEYAAKASKELGVLTEEQYGVMVGIHALIGQGNQGQARTDLDSLADHISAREFVELRGLIDASDADQLQVWVQAKRDFAGTAGLVRKAASTFMSTVGDQARKHLGGWYENFKAPAPELDAFSGLLEEMAAPKVEEVVRTPQEVEAAIGTQRDLLVRNGSLMATTKAVLGWACGIQNLDNAAIVSYIEDANQAGGDFQTLLFTQIDAADNVGAFRKLWAKACYYMFTPLIGFYVEHFTNNFLNYFRAQLAEFHNGNFSGALNQSVGFLNDHLQTVYGAYANAADARDRHAAIDPLIKQDLARDLHNGGMTRQQLYVRAAEEAVERFAPVSSLRERVSDALGARIPEDSGWSWLNYPIAVVTGVVSIVVYPVFYVMEWAGNAVAKATLKKLAVDLELVPTLIASTGQAVGVGNEYKHAMNTLLVRQLERAYEMMLSHEESAEQIDLSEFERNLPDETRANLKTFVSSLFLDLGCALHSDNPAALAAYMEAQRTQAMPESLKALIEALGIPLDIQGEAKETTVKYLALLLRTVLQQDMLQELTLTSLETLNTSCFTHAAERPSEEQMKATEARRNKLINDIITCAIRQAVNDKFYPMKRIQKEADQFVLKLHGEIGQFAKEMEALKGEGKFSDMRTRYRQFILVRDRALNTQQGSPNVNNRSLANFNTISRALAEKLVPMQEVLATLSRLEQASKLSTKQRDALGRLDTIYKRLAEDHSEQDARDLTVQMMRQAELETLPALDGSEDLRLVRQQLQIHFNDIYPAMNDWSSAQEAIAIAEILEPIVRRNPSRQRTNDILEAIAAYKFTSPMAETIRQTLNTQARAVTLDKAAITAMIEAQEEIIQRSAKTVADCAEYTATIEPLIEGRGQALVQHGQSVQEQVEQLDAAVKALTEWASDKDALEQQIGALQKGQDQPKAKAADDEASESEFDTDKLHPFQCQNTFAFDLTAFADTVQEFVVRQIAAYTNALPLFFSKDYNLDATMHRLLVAFVNDQRQPVIAPVVV